jgi:hypothetical protein
MSGEFHEPPSSILNGPCRSLNAAQSVVPSCFHFTIMSPDADLGNLRRVTMSLTNFWPVVGFIPPSWLSNLNMCLGVSHSSVRLVLLVSWLSSLLSSTSSFSLPLPYMFLFDVYLKWLISAFPYDCLKFSTGFPGHLMVPLAPVARFCRPILLFCYCPFSCVIMWSGSFLFMLAVISCHRDCLILLPVFDLFHLIMMCFMCL